MFPTAGAIRAGATALMDLIFPHRCPACETNCSARRVFCPVCLQSVHPIGPPLCPRCFLPYPSGPDRLCPACVNRPPPYRKAVALFEYGGQVGRAVRSLKYHGRLHAARTLGRLMKAHVVALEPDLVVPVPLHKRRLRKRGFNHATELARWACRGTGFKVAPAVLARRRDGPTQAGSTPAQRRSLPPSAFAVVRPAAVRGKSILLVDDVMTTGATAAACSKALMRGSAGAVDVITLCRSVL